MDTRQVRDLNARMRGLIRECRAIALDLGVTLYVHRFTSHGVTGYRLTYSGNNVTGLIAEYLTNGSYGYVRPRESETHGLTGRLIANRLHDTGEMYCLRETMREYGIVLDNYAH